MPPAGTSPYAALRAGDEVFYSIYVRGAREPASPLTRLIQGLYDLHPGQARGLLRNRIHCVGFEPGEMDRGMAKVAAKRLSLEPVGPGGRAVEVVPFERILPSPPALAGREDAFWLARARTLAAAVPRLGARHDCDRPIAALIVSADGTLLAEATHAGTVNPTLHAEVRVLQDLHRRTGRALPAGATLFTTLKPCRMCAGMIHESAETLTLSRVVYGEHDPGPMAARTALDGRPYQLMAGAPSPAS